MTNRNTNRTPTTTDATTIVRVSLSKSPESSSEAGTGNTCGKTALIKVAYQSNTELTFTVVMVYMSPKTLALSEITLRNASRCIVHHLPNLSVTYSSVCCEVSSCPLSELSPNRTTSVLEDYNCSHQHMRAVLHVRISLWALSLNHSPSSLLFSSRAFSDVID